MTFAVCTPLYGSRPYGEVGAAFYVTLRSVTFYVVMTAHACSAGDARSDIWPSRLLGGQLALDS